MPCQAVPALIGKYEIMLCQVPGCLMNLNNFLRNKLSFNGN